MFAKATKGKLWRLAAVVGASGMLFGSSCSTEQIQAVAAGIGAVANQLDGGGSDDISFGDWLRDESSDW